MKKYLFTLLLSASFIGLFANIHNPKSQKIANYANISVAQARDTILTRINDPWFVILDVRTPTEYASLHLEEGVSLDFYAADFSAKLAALNRDKIYLLHCASGGRSAQVYTMMQNLNFQTVYNMLGGTNAWVNAAYPTVTSVAPVLGLLCDTAVNFNNTPVNATDSVKITLTNAANDTLRFMNITDLSGTDFSTDFDTNTTLFGALDYSFYIYYTPTDLFADSLVFTVQTNGGAAQFTLHGTATPATNINRTDFTGVNVFNDLNNRQIVLTADGGQKISFSLYDMGGKLMLASYLFEKQVIDCASFKNGIYFLSLKTSENIKTYKLPLFY